MSFFGSPNARAIEITPRSPPHVSTASAEGARCQYQAKDQFEMRVIDRAQRWPFLGRNGRAIFSPKKLPIWEGLV